MCQRSPVRGLILWARLGLVPTLVVVWKLHSWKGADGGLIEGHCIHEFLWKIVGSIIWFRNFGQGGVNWAQFCLPKNWPGYRIYLVCKLDAVRKKECLVRGAWCTCTDCTLYSASESKQMNSSWWPCPTSTLQTWHNPCWHFMVIYIFYITLFFFPLALQKDAHSWNMNRNACHAMQLRLNTTSAADRTSSAEYIAIPHLESRGQKDPKKFCFIKRKTHLVSV